MNDPGGLQHSLAAMGLAEMALALFCLICYCLVLNAAVTSRVRSVAGVLAVVAATALVAATDPWTNGVILVALGIAAIGAFVVAAWLISAACGLAVRRTLGQRPPDSDESVSSAWSPTGGGRTASMSLGAPLETPR